MTNEQLHQTSHDLLYLTACALHGTPPDEEYASGMDLQKLYHLCRLHTMTAIVCTALENTSAFAAASPELQEKWKDAKNKAIRKNIMLDAERSTLFAWMEQQGIWHMPLKGSILKDLYPKVGMRQMADNDILYDKNFQLTVKDYMQSRGYKVISVGKGTHDVYEKPPVYNFELHTALFGPEHDPAWTSYYANVKQRLLKDEGKAYAYHFRDEDFYVYLLTHAFKHYDSSGTGLRSLLDVYVYIWTNGSTLDWKYIRQEEEKLGIAAFEHQCRVLSQKLFDEPNTKYEQLLSEDEQEMLLYFSGSGMYGTTLNRTKKRLEQIQPDGAPITRKTRILYYWQRLFPNMDWFKAYAPFCYRHKWSIPFFLVYRFCRGMLFRRQKVKYELQSLRKITEE
jgi:hypothetical protein